MKELISKEKAEDIANELYSWAQSAVGDLASGDEIAADEFWEDPDTMADLLGDRIFDETSEHLRRENEGFTHGDFNKVFCTICQSIKQQYGYHAATVKAMDGLIKRRS